MSRAAQAKLFWGVVIDLADVPVDKRNRHDIYEEGDFGEWSHEELFKHHDVRAIGFDDNAERRVGIYSGKLYSAEWGDTAIPALAQSDGDFACFLETLGLEPQEPAWHLVAEYR